MIIKHMMKTLIILIANSDFMINQDRIDCRCLCSLIDTKNDISSNIDTKTRLIIDSNKVLYLHY
jgi:hypothetical protein